MIAVIFDAETTKDTTSEYLDIKAQRRPLLAVIHGFINIKRFQSLTNPDKVLARSCWRDKAAIAAWRTLPQHRAAQGAGSDHVFADNRLRIATVGRDYGECARDQSPADNRSAHS